MNYQIRKHSLSLNVPLPVPMPLGSKILHVGVQGNTPNIWTMEPVDEDNVYRYFICYATGDVINGSNKQNLVHIGTAIQPDGDYVVHVFEARESEEQKQ